MGDLAVKTAFRLSRAYAEGWNAARQLDLEKAGAMPNPYPNEPERTRWNEGFAKAAD